MKLFAGASLDRPPGPKYTAALPFAELRFRSPVPKVATLRKWRGTAPEGLATTFIVPHGAMVSPAGAFRGGEAEEEAKRWIIDGATAIDARFVLMRTPASLSPGQRDRDRFEAFVDALREGGVRDVAWQPRGAWDDVQANRFAERIGVVRAYDPLEDEAPDGPIRYGRLETVGARSRITPGILHDAWANLIDVEAEEVYLAIESDRSFRDAQAALDAARAALGL